MRIARRSGRSGRSDDELRRRQTPLELNPTSNVRTGVCSSFAEHPLRTYFDTFWTQALSAFKEAVEQQEEA